MRPTNTQPPDGDIQFLGVNQADPPAALPPGTLSDALNNRCRHGRAEPRLGPVKLPWTNKVTAGASSTPIPYGAIYGAGTFRDSDDLQWGIIAADGRVFRTREGNGSAEVPLPPGITITSPVEFEQTYNGLVMFRGADLPELLMKTLDAGFISIVPEANVVTGATSENQSDGTEEIPNADRGAFINGRLFVPYATATEKDLVAISDYNNSTRYAPVRSQARINQGSADKLVRILKFGNSEVAVCFKENSVYQLAGISGALADMQQDEVTREFGLAAPKAAINVGKEDIAVADSIWFLVNRRGLLAIAPDPATGRLGVQSVPVSREVGAIIERINWEAIAVATFAVWDNKFYAALPLDDARAMGPDLIRGGTYLGGDSKAIIPGHRYLWTKGANDTSLQDGADNYTDTTEFVATGYLASLNGSVGEDITATLQHVYEGVNNAVLVFDFERGLWCSLDTGSALQVKEWLKLRFSGEERLFFLGADGFINCYEWLFDDHAAYETIDQSPSNNLLAGESFGADGIFSMPTTNGRTYIFSVPAGETLVNGTDSFTDTYGSFVALADLTDVTGPAAGTSSGNVWPVDWVIVNEDIDHDITLRGFTHGSLARKRGLWARFHFRSWYPSLSISEITEGVEEEIMRLTSATKSRIRYTRPHSKPDYDATNINDDHATPHREDYSVILEENTVASGAIVAGTRYLVESSDVATTCSISYNSVTVNNGETFVGVAGVTTFTVLTGTPLVKPPDSYVFFDGAGIDPDLHQEWHQDVRLHSHGRARQFRVRNQQGRCELVAVELVGKDEDQRLGKRT